MTWSYQYAGDMLRLYRKAFAASKAGQRVRLHWNDDAMDLEAWRAAFMLALHRRINLKAGPEPSYRKLDDSWQVGCRRDQRRLRDIAQRVRVYQFETAEVAERFGHLLADYQAPEAKPRARRPRRSVEKIMAEFRARHPG